MANLHPEDVVRLLAPPAAPLRLRMPPLMGLARNLALAALTTTAEATLRAAFRQHGLMLHHYHHFARRAMLQHQQARRAWIDDLRARYLREYSVNVPRSYLGRLTGLGEDV